MTTMLRNIFILSYCLPLAGAFMPLSPPQYASSGSAPLASTATESEADSTVPAVSPVSDPKEVVKLFGRLADKYILLDSSGGMCCYSACTDCEYRLPDGGYRMADQSSSRPKWICAYDDRSFEASGKEHASKWSIDLYTNYDNRLAVTKDEFIQGMIEIKYNPPLGGPYLGASAAKIEDTTAVEYLFDLLAGGKEKLTKHRFGTQIKAMAGGEEGLTWAAFEKKILGVQ